MPKRAKVLSALAVKNLKHSGRSAIPERHLVGDVAGLMVQITPNNEKSWVLRTTISGKQRFLGLGSYRKIELADARKKANKIIVEIETTGIDPIEKRKQDEATSAAQKLRGRTFAEATAEYLDAKLTDKSKKHREQWRSTLTTYALPMLGALAVDDVSVNDILRVLEPIWTTKTETASRVRSRIEAVLTYATVKGYRKSRENPAQWAGNLKEVLPSPKKIAKVQHYPAVQIKDMPRWYAALQKSDSISALALEFLCLTACRSGEVRGTVWNEIDLNEKVWVVPAARMKMKKEHRVPLSDRAIEILQSVPRFAGSQYVFPSPTGRALSNMAMSEFMRDMHKREEKAGRKAWVDKSGEKAVVHGLRSVFRDWCAESTNYPREVAEMSLAHAIGDKVEAAYRRGDLFEKRRQLMRKWAQFCATS